MIAIAGSVAAGMVLEWWLRAYILSIGSRQKAEPAWDFEKPTPVSYLLP